MNGAVHPTAHPEQAAPRRGRPVGARTATVRTSTLGHHHFAFLRAVAEGLHAGQAAERYLVSTDRVDSRTAQAYARELTKRVLASVQAMRDTGLIAAGHALQDGMPSVLAGQTPKQPSLDEFAGQFDEDMYSQAELQELYDERYGSDVDSARLAARSRLIEAIDLLQSKLAKHPKAEDPVVLWLSDDVAQKLLEANVRTLGEFLRWKAAQGITWYRRLPRVGKQRAARILTWLESHQLEEGQDLPGVPLVVARTFPDEPTSWCRLAQFRSAGPNTLGATNDAEAIKAWLHHLASKSQNTAVAYRREVERLWLWAVNIRGLPLSGLNSRDLQDFVAFAKHPPKDWVSALPYARQHASWRPFRGPLGQASLDRLSAVVRQLYNDLMASGYLIANPAATLHVNTAHVTRLDVQRSFSRDEQAYIHDQLQRLPMNARSRRLCALVKMLVGTGLRASEACSTWAQISFGHHGEKIAILSVTGKGGRERRIPLHPDVMRALLLHKQDLRDAGAQDSPELPLIGRLHSPPGRFRGQMDSCNAVWQLTASGLAIIVRRFLRSIAADAPDAHKFRAASTHWFRHTFGHVLVRSTNDAPTAQKLLGHASLHTTGIYIEAQLDERVMAIHAMQTPLLDAASNF
jgi:site-specific recombinase XerD